MQTIQKSLADNVTFPPKMALKIFSNVFLGQAILLLSSQVLTLRFE